MKKEILLLLLIGLCPVVFADGLPINPYNYHLAGMSQESQIAYVDFDGEKSTVSLFVSFDFAGYDKDEMIWIVPFKDIPDNIDLEETTLYKFEQEFSDFDKGIENATNLKRAYESDIPGALGIATTLHYLPVFALVPIFIVGSSAGSAGEMVVPENSFDFGSLGRADVYTISDKVTLQQFFQEKGVQVPSNLGSFLDKHIVVFSINKTREKMRTLVTFDFSNKSELFYPSSTTALWEGTPENYIVKVRAPLHYKLSPNLKPNLEINDLQYQYMLFSPSCIGLSGSEYLACQSITGYYGYGYEFDAERFRQRASTRPELKYLLELYDTDLEIEVKEERKSLPLGMYAANFVNPWILAVLFIFVSWIAATYVYSRFKKKYTNKETLQIALIGLLFWTALNIGFSILFLIIFLLPIFAISMLAWSFYYALMLLQPIVFIADLAIVLFLFKILVVDRFDKIFIFPKGKVRFRDFITILLSALLINTLLIVATLLIFQIPL